MQSISGTRKRRVSRSHKEQLFQQAPEQSFNDAVDAGAAQDADAKSHKNERSADKIRGADEQTTGESMNGEMNHPYEFLNSRNPSLHTIFVPRFAVRSITFVLSLVFIALFASLLIYSYTRPQSDLTWNCSLYQLQNKYFPRLRYNYQFWRVPISAFFHSNVAHFLLNLLGIQVYGYFVEWYYSKAKLTLTLAFAIVFAHFLAAAAQPLSVSTTSSSVLFAILGLKVYFLYQYRDYRFLDNRRVFVYLLLSLIAAINLIPIFVVNNVDYSAYIGGLLSGLAFGLHFHLAKEEQQTCYKILKHGILIIISLALVACIAVVFATDNETYRALNDNIGLKCNS